LQHISTVYRITNFYFPEQQLTAFLEQQRWYLERDSGNGKCSTKAATSSRKRTNWAQTTEQLAGSTFTAFRWRPTGCCTRVTDFSGRTLEQYGTFLKVVD